MKLTGLFVFRKVVELGYIPLESFLSVEPILDEAIVCYDPADGDEEEHRLVKALSDKFPKVRAVEFVWPKKAPGDGSVIGIASNFALAQAAGDFCLNVQADEIYPVALRKYIGNNWRNDAVTGYDSYRIKVLNTEHNVQQYQGGNETSSWSWQSGAGYNCAIKLFKKCPGIRFAHDAWSMDGCNLFKHLDISETFPIIHCHDMHRDTLVKLRQTAANEIWTDREKFGAYKATADGLEATIGEWYDDPKWTKTYSPFDHLLPDFAKPMIGQTRYVPDYSLLERY